MNDKRIRLLLCLIFSCVISTYGQVEENDNEEISDSTKIFILVEVLPEFPGGIEKLRKTIEKNIKYPKSAKKDGIEGKVITQFTIDTLGNPVDIKILQSVREDLDNEAIRVITLLKGWKPATANGRKVTGKMTLPLTFHRVDKH